MDNAPFRRPSLARLRQRLASIREFALTWLEEVLDLPAAGLDIVTRQVCGGRRPSRPAGPWGEARAARFLRRRGLHVLERNVRSRSGEIDLVALEGRTLVFVEVKTVARSTRVRGLDRIGPTKQRRLARAMSLYLRRCRRDIDRWRLDAVVIEYRHGRLGQRVVVRVDWYPVVVDTERLP